MHKDLVSFKHIKEITTRFWGSSLLAHKRFKKVNEIHCWLIHTKAMYSFQRHHRSVTSQNPDSNIHPYAEYIATKSRLSVGLRQRKVTNILQFFHLVLCCDIFSAFTYYYITRDFCYSFILAISANIKKWQK